MGLRRNSAILKLTQGSDFQWHDGRQKCRCKADENLTGADSAVQPVTRSLKREMPLLVTDPARQR